MKNFFLVIKKFYPFYKPGRGYSIYSLILILAFILLGSCEKDAKIGPGQDDTFIKFFGSSFEDVGFDVKQTNDGGYVVVGTITRNVIGSRGNTSMILIRTDKYGNLLWEPKLFNGENNSRGYSIQITPDGGYILLGSAVSAKPGGIESYDFYLVRTDNRGDTIWTRKYGSAGNDEGYSVIINSNNNYILAGYSEISGNGDKSALVMEVDQSGNLLWDNAFGGNRDDDARFIKEIDGGYIFVGTTESFSGGTSSNIFVVRLNESGVGIALGIHGANTANHSGVSIRELEDGTFMLLGTSVDMQSGLSRISLYKLSQQISIVESIKSYPEIGDAYGTSLDRTGDGNFIITGAINDNVSGNLLLMKVDSNGEIIFRNTFGDDTDQAGRAATPTTDGGYIITGSNKQEHNSMILLLKTNSDGSL